MFYVTIVVIWQLMVSSASSIYLDDEWIVNEYNKVPLYQYANYLQENKYTYHLGYSDYDDLLETIFIINDEFKNDKVFSINDIIALIIKESRFNHLALNKSDGGKGLGQITNINLWWREELSFVTDLYDKKQNIKSIRICLNTFYNRYGDKYKAIKHYNGSTRKSELYANDVLRMSLNIKNNI